MKVCQRWRYLILGSASYLGLCLVCSPGTPVVEMLAHSPPFPLIVFHDDSNHALTPEDERQIMFALEHRDRVRRICLIMPLPCLEKVIKAMEDEFPMLEYLQIAPPTTHNTHLALPATFRAPQLELLLLDHFASPIESPLLTTATNLVWLVLRWIYPSTNLYPNDLLPALSLLPRLQNLIISFSSPVPNNEIKRHMLHTPNIIHTTLSNLRRFDFGGDSAYLEALVSHMNAPLLKRLSVNFFYQPIFSIPHLGQFVTTAEDIRFSRVDFLFYHKAVVVFMYFSSSALSPTLDIRVDCEHLNGQVSSMVQIFNVLNPLFSTVVDLTLDYRSQKPSLDQHNQSDRTQWRQLLGSFGNVRTLRVHDGLVGEVSHCLASDGEPVLEILPNLKTLVSSMGRSRDGDEKTFAKFVHDREVAGLPIDLIEDTFPEYTYRFKTAAGLEYVD